MRKIIYIALFVFGLSSCEPEIPRNMVVMSGYVLANSDSVFVQYFEMDQDGYQIPVENAELEIKRDGLSWYLKKNSNGIYYRDDVPFDFNAGEIVVLEAFGNTASQASALIPPNIQILESSSPVVDVNADNPFEEVYSTSWLNQEGYSYLLKLECLETDPVEIPFGVPSGLFQNTFSGPIEESNLIVFASDFKYFGAHRLTIYIIEEEYSSLFFLRNQALGLTITEGADNISGGKGFWTGINAIEINLNLE